MCPKECHIYNGAIEAGGFHHGASLCNTAFCGPGSGRRLGCRRSSLRKSAGMGLGRSCMTSLGTNRPLHEWITGHGTRGGGGGGKPINKHRKFVNTVTWTGACNSYHAPRLGEVTT